MRQLQKIIFPVLFLSIWFWGCEKEINSEDKSGLTYYVEHVLEGDKTTFIPLGTEFVEPGYRAFEHDTEVTDRVKVVHNIDHNTIGLYKVVYSTENTEGLESQTERIVLVYDPNAPDIDLSGEYSAKVFRMDNKSEVPDEDYENYTVEIEKITHGVFLLSDWLGGFYEYGRGLGESFSWPGLLSLEADTTIELINGYIGETVSEWKDPIDSVYNGGYNQETEELKYNVAWRKRYSFTLNIKKK